MAIELSPEAEVEGLRAALVVVNADLRVQQSRVSAYQETCHKQGTKLARIEKILMAASNEQKNGVDVTSLTIGFATFSDKTLQAIAEVMQEKGSNR